MMWQNKEKQQMPMERVLKRTLCNTSPRCLAGEEEVPELLLPSLQQPRLVAQRKYPSGSYRACNSDKPSVLQNPSPTVQALVGELDRTLILPLKLANLSMTEFSAISAVASLLSRLQKDTFLTVRKNTKLIL